MKREIKFKFVYKNDLELFKMSESFELDKLIHITEDDIYCSLSDCKCQPVGETNVVECNCDTELEGYTLCDKVQFTGLKDKNGVEIYEEDIVAVSNRKRKAKTEPTYTTTIVYRWHGFTLDKNDTYFTDSACINKQCEVIGNIYQNPELLNK